MSFFKALWRRLRGGGASETPSSYVLHCSEAGCWNELAGIPFAEAADNFVARVYKNGFALVSADYADEVRLRCPACCALYGKPRPPDEWSWEALEIPCGLRHERSCTRMATLPVSLPRTSYFSTVERQNWFPLIRDDLGGLMADFACRMCVSAVHPTLVAEFDYRRGY